MTKEGNAEKRARFLRLAQNRTNKVLKSITTLSHCSNRSLYDYRDEEVDKIFDVIEKSLFESKIKFKKEKLIDFKL